MLSDISFGQFYPTKSFVHAMDPRAKLLIVIVFMVAIFLASSVAATAFLLLFLVLAIIAARIPVRTIFKSIKPIVFIIVFTAVINILFYRKGNILVEWWIFRITDLALLFSLRMAIRLVMLFLSATLLTLTTTPVALTDGIESLLKPLKVIHFPVHEFALIMSIALRFIPTLMEETDRIIRAQKARGADFESGNIFKKAKALLPVLIPLLVSAFNRADELADAMDSRCYSGAKGRTKMKKLRFGWRDGLSALFILNTLLFVCLDKWVLLSSFGF